MSRVQLFIAWFLHRQQQFISSKSTKNNNPPLNKNKKKINEKEIKGFIVP